MIGSLLESWWPITAVLSDETVTNRKYRSLDLSTEQWVILEDLLVVLKPLEAATTVFSGEKKKNTPNCIWHH